MVGAGASQFVFVDEADGVRVVMIYQLIEYLRKNQPCQARNQAQIKKFCNQKANFKPLIYLNLQSNIILVTIIALCQCRPHSYLVLRIPIQ